MDIYREEIIDHYKNPRNFGEMTDYTTKVFEVNTLCGDSIEVFLKIKDGIIVDIKFRSIGCAISVASASMLTEMVKGKKIKEISDIKEDFVLKLLGGEISPARRKCAFLSLIALRKAIKDIII